jgi:hypothetical protein
MLQNVVVALIVVVAVLYVGNKYLPARWRQNLLYRLRQRGTGETKLAKWLATDAGCGSGCKTCGSCADTPAAPENGKKVIKLHLRR